MVATATGYQRGWWRYRLKGSTMLGHAAPLKQPIDVAQLKDFYQNGTPRRHDADRGECRQPQRCRANQRPWRSEGQAGNPAAVPTLSPLPTVPVSIMTNAVRQDKPSIMGCAMAADPRLRGAAALRVTISPVKRCSGTHAAEPEQNNVKDIGLGFDCRAISARSAPSISIPGRAPEQQPERGFARAGESAGQRLPRGV